MFLDYRTVAGQALIEADLCIVGAGALRGYDGSGAGGITRPGLPGRGGGLEFEPDVQDVYAGPNVGHSYADLDVARLRFFGGTTNHWNGLCVPLQPIDVRPRRWVPHSGWPITRQDLDPFYRRAQPICQLGPYAYDAETWGKLRAEPHAFDANEVELCFWQHSPPTRFGEVYRADLERAENVRVLLHGNVTSIQTDPRARSCGTSTCRGSRVSEANSERMSMCLPAAGSRTRVYCCCPTRWNQPASAIGTTWLAASSWSTRIPDQE